MVSSPAIVIARNLLFIVAEFQLKLHFMYRMSMSILSDGPTPSNGGKWELT